VDFEQVLKEVVWRLVTEGSVSYRRIKRSFGLDDGTLEDVRRVLIGALHIATDLDGEFLVLAAEGRLARSEGTALSQPLPTLRLAERPSARVAGRDLPVAAPVSSAPAAVAAAPDAERRQLTVMFCDLVGSTALSTGMDPEDLCDVIASFQSRCSASIRHYDGFVAKYMGDCILVYFGYPRAHEDEAERSVRAGLDIVEAMAELNAAFPRPPGVELAVRIGIYMGDGVLIYFGYPQAHEDDAERAVRAGLGVIDAVGRLDVNSIKLQARVGIATGLVVVGDLIGAGSAQEQSVVGETPNLAARLQALAKPDAVVTAAGTTPAGR
jgi:class 3 adenylate cyclase